MILIVLFSAATAATWWLYRPRGVVRLHVNPKLEAKADSIETHMRYALAATHDFSEQARKLILVAIRAPAHALPNPVSVTDHRQFEDVLEFATTLKLSVPPAKLLWHIDLTRLLTLLYEPFGFVDPRLIVHDFEQTSETDDPHVHALIQLEPYDVVGQRIPAATRAPVPLTAFRQLTAKYIIETLERTIGDRDCRRVLCVSELPDSLAILEATVDAFEFLSNGRTDARCQQSESDEVCIRRIRETFVNALQLDPANNFARLGVGLAELRLFKALLPATASATAGRYFMEGVANIASATKDSPYLRTLLATDDWQQYLRETPGLEGFDITPEFIDVADNYRAARTAFVRAEFKATLLAIARLEGHLPEAARPHVKNLELTAKLFLARNATEATPLLHEFSTLAGETPDGTWLANYAILLSRWNDNDPNRIDTALRSIDRAIDLANDSIITLLDRKAHKGICLALLGRHSDALTHLTKLETELPPDYDKVPRDSMRLYYNLGIAFSLAGDQARAGVHLKKAVTMDRVYLDGISRLPFLSSFRDWSGYDGWKKDLLSLQSAGT